MPLYYQIHKYKSGHQLVAGTVALDRIDQDTLDRLSDISGQLRPGEIFDPYFTCYPLPSLRYFVVAKTWQDLSAPRAGCVLTKSIIVLKEDWETMVSVAPLFEALKHSSLDLQFPEVLLNRRDDFLESIIEGPLEELTEALFLEQRKPIVVFDCPWKERVAIRLYDVLWPDLRMKFATCTFALAPRSIANRPFDLLFTTANVRTRFSDWNGRRIEGGLENRRPARHKWTHDLAFRVFKEVPPSLFDKDPESLFNLTHARDESTLRLSLLWDELLIKAKFESSPMAILGLLDIINTQPIFAEKLYSVIEPQIRKAVHNALENLESLDAWKFYAGLLVKHKRKLMGRSMLFEVKYACTNLTYSAPLTAIEFISNFNPAKEKTPSILYASIGNGLAQYAARNKVTFFDKMNEKTGVSLLAASTTFAELLMQEIAQSKGENNTKVRAYLKYPDSKARNRARKNIEHYISSPKHLNITKLLLEDASFSDFQSIISTLARNSKFQYRSFDDLILKSTAFYNSSDFLLSLLSKYINKESNELLIRLLQNFPSTIASYLSGQQFSLANQSLVMPQVMKDLNEDEYIKLGNDKEVAERLVSILIKDKKFDKAKLGQFVLFANIALSDKLKSIGELQANIINDLDFSALFDVLNKAFNIQELTLLGSKILSKLGESQAGMVLSKFLEMDLDGTSSKRLLEILYSSGACFKRALIKQIDKVSELLAETLSAALDERIISIWGTLIKGSNEIEKQRRAAAWMLRYAFYKTKHDPTILILISYPIVYRAYKEDRSFGEALVGWMFHDWDRCKTLRHDLIDRYLESNWSAFGLFQVGKKAGILKEVFSILGDSKKGRLYLESASIDASENDLAVDKSIAKQLKKYSKHK